MLPDVHTEKTTLAVSNLMDFKKSNAGLPDPFDNLGLETRLDFFGSDEEEDDSTPDGKWWKRDSIKEGILTTDFRNQKSTTKTRDDLEAMGVPAVGVTQLENENIVGANFNVDRWLHKWGEKNGQIPVSALKPIGNGHYLRKDAALAWKAAVRAARKDGVDLTLTDSYRDLQTQKWLYYESGKREQGIAVAVPGTSNHGIGVAVDVALGREWLNAHPEFGFEVLPSEEWHFDYKGGYEPAYKGQRKRKKKVTPPRQRAATIREQGFDDSEVAPEWNAMTVLGFTIADTVRKPLIDEEPAQTAERVADAQRGDHLDFVPKSLRRYFEIAAKKTGISMQLLEWQAMAESSFSEDVMNGERLSSAGAIGIMQLMPGTAEYLGVDPYDHKQNIIGGARYLAEQLQRFGNLKDALAAYNAGPGRYTLGVAQQYAADILKNWRDN